jgi:hypothetical protein
MVCEHLRAIETELLERGIRETSRGQAWSKSCREWVYFDCYLDAEALRARFALPDHVVHHEHAGMHDGMESGLSCKRCHDAIMGHHPRSGTKAPTIR